MLDKLMVIRKRTLALGFAKILENSFEMLEHEDLVKIF